MTSTLSHPSSTRATRSTHRPAWAGFGIVAGVAGIASVVCSGLAGGVYDPDSAGDAPALVAVMADQIPQILAFHVATMVGALTLVVFAAGLHRQLVRRVGADSVLPGVAGIGLVLVSVAQLLGAGLTTEFAFGLTDPDQMVAENAVFFGHWIATIPWLWVGAGLAAIVVGVAARRGAYPTWLGRTSFALGGLMVLFGISPLQYVAGMFGPLWLLVTAIALFVAGRED